MTAHLSRRAAAVPTILLLLATTAAVRAGVCGSGGSCFVSHSAPGCDIVACCETVCAQDPFCCDVSWDNICVSEAVAKCGCGGAKSGDCFAVHDSPGCDDAVCCETVCDDDPFCCDVVWDNFCVTGANQRCCGGALAPSCFVFHLTPACNVTTCCESVCAQDPPCCTIQWDETCVDQAMDLCTCGGDLAGSCFLTQPHPGCADATCCEEICSFDSFCCDVHWDGVCAQNARLLCCGGPDSGSCFEPHDSSACTIESCCDAVCAQDTFCCVVGWDFNCVNAALAKCTCGGASAGDCFSSHPAPGCDDADCCEAVCAVLPFCCDFKWAGLCAALAVDLCAPDPDGDVNDDGHTDVADLVLVILDWGCQAPPPGCQGDANGDGATDVSDMIVVIVAWNP